MEIVTPRTEVLIKYVKLAERLVLQTDDGILPSVTWLKGNGHTGLYQYMRAHPSKFNHIVQQRLGVRSYDENVKKRQVALANKLVRQNGGTLPTVTWLTIHGYSGLLSYIWKHPEFFSIRRDINKKSPQEHVAAAEALARKHGGSLPGGWTIVNESGWALYQFMRRNHELFAHIKGFSRGQPGREVYPNSGRAVRRNYDISSHIEGAPKPEKR